MSNNLKFIHITKTAGTSIENIGFKHNILWGRYDKKYGWWHRTNIFKNYEFMIKIPYMMKYDFFLVCRNPYDRILSQFHCKFGGVGKNIKHFNKIKMNKYIQNKIKTRGWNSKIRGSGFTEQYKYLPPKLLKINTHVLHFENLETEFNDLMFKYNLPIKLDVKDNCSVKKFTIKDFSKRTIRLINNVYNKDFIIFNYDKIIL